MFTKAMVVLSKINLLILCCSCLLGFTPENEHNSSSVAFFASNNINIIDMRTAYERLTGHEQAELQDEMINVLQKNHIEQGRFKNILGTYRMSNEQIPTADNTEEFDLSPYQHLSTDQIFFTAKELALALKQESIAVLIPSNATIGDITVNFTSNHPSTNEVIQLLQDKLPALYSQAFSLHLQTTPDDFANAKVAKIEWLGSKIKLDEIRKAFPFAKVNSRYGDVFLVYQNGQIKQM